VSTRAKTDGDLGMDDADLRIAARALDATVYDDH
jgi:hypothetical protein